MNTIYTLRSENVGPLKHLNGKMFTIEFDYEGHMTLNDVITKDWLRKTTRIVETRDTVNGVIYTTASGAVYDLINVSSILPSNQSNKEVSEPFKVDLADLLNDFPIDGDSELPELEAIPIPVEIQERAAKVVMEMQEKEDEVAEEAINNDDIPEVIDEFNINRAIYYGDGYYGVVFKFADEVTYEQFIRFCKAKGMKVPERGYAWYEDHPMVFNQRILDGEHHPNKGASENDTSPVWTWLWVRAYTD